MPLIPVFAADFRSRHSVAVGSRERNRGRVCENAVLLAEQRHVFHGAGGVLHERQQEQVELLQDVREGGGRVRFWRQGVSTQGHLRSRLRPVRRPSRFAGTIGTDLPQVNEPCTIRENRHT